LKKLGYLYIMLAAFLFSTIGIIGKLAINTGIKVYDLVIFQYGTAILIILLYFLVKGIKELKITKKQAKTMVIQGFIGNAGTTIFYYMALERMNAGVASILLFTNPVVVNLYFILSKTKKINAINNIALSLAMLGSALVIDVLHLDFAKTPLVGLTFGILACLSYSFFSIYADTKLKDNNPLVINFYTSLVVLFVTLVINPSFFKFQVELTPNVLGYVLLLAVVSGILPIIFTYKGISLIGAEKATIVSTCELPVTLLLAYFLLKEKMIAIQVVGVVMIILSIIILQNEDRILGLEKDSTSTTSVVRDK